MISIRQIFTRQNFAPYGNSQNQLIAHPYCLQKLAATSIQTAQASYKEYYDKKSHSVKYRVAEWVLIHFPHEEMGQL